MFPPCRNIFKSIQIILGIRIHRTLVQGTHVMSESTRNMHRELMQVEIKSNHKVLIFMIKMWKISSRQNVRCRRFEGKKVVQKAANVDEKISRSQALTVQSSLTIVFAVACASYLLMQFDVAHGPVIEYSTHMVRFKIHFTGGLADEEFIYLHSSRWCNLCALIAREMKTTHVFNFPALLFKEGKIALDWISEQQQKRANESICRLLCEQKKSFFRWANSCCVSVLS